MNNKAFTLIELLAVLTIIGIISLIAIPSIGGVINTTKESSYQRTLDNIDTAIKNYYIKNQSIINTSQNISKLINNNYIDHITINNQECNGNFLIKKANTTEDGKTLPNYIYNYYIILGCGDNYYASSDINGSVMYASASANTNINDCTTDPKTLSYKADDSSPTYTIKEASTSISICKTP